MDETLAIATPAVGSRAGYRKFDATVRARLAGVLGVTPGGHTGPPHGVRPAYPDIMEEIHRLAGGLEVHYLSVLRWIRRDPALRAAMPKGRIITGSQGGHPSRRTAATVTAILAIYRRSTSLRATAAEAGMPFGTLLQWTQDDRVFGAAVTSIYKERLQDGHDRRLAARAVRRDAQAMPREAALAMARALADPTAGDALAPDVPA